MYHTENDTTAQIGDAVATVIADSVSSCGRRITTLELVYPRIIHSELLTHRQFSRNASSSRATPVRTMIREVREHPFIPSVWRYAQKGMSAGERMSEVDARNSRNDYVGVMNAAITAASALAETGAAKEHVNRLLEPFSFVRTLVTATEWENFFTLRLSKAAQPEIQDLARAMQTAMRSSAPVTRGWHVPYVNWEEVAEPLASGNTDCLLRSAARCARVSYMRHDGTEPSADSDLSLARRLLADRHMSPFEHVARAAHVGAARYANFIGWQSFRNTLETSGA